MSHEINPSRQYAFVDYAIYCHELGFPLGTLNTIHGKLSSPEQPDYWRGVFDNETDSINTVRLSEALDISLQHGQIPRTGAYRYYEGPQKLGAATVASLTLFAHAHTGLEQLPDPRIEDEVAKSVAKRSPKAAISSYDIFAYGDQLGYKRSRFIDDVMKEYHASWMRQRLPEFPMRYEYDYEAISAGAIYPVVNGVAFTGYEQPLERAIDTYCFDNELMPLPYANNAPPPTRYRGLTPGALAADTYRDLYEVACTVHATTFATLLKYIKALRQAGLHNELPPTIDTDTSDPMS